MNVTRTDKVLTTSVSQRYSRLQRVALSPNTCGSCGFRSCCCRGQRQLPQQQQQPRQATISMAAASEAPAATGMPESWSSPPKGFKVYETMIIYNPDAADGDREGDIQGFQDLLTELGALDIAVSYENVPQRMAYPIEGYNVGIYVLYMYSAPAKAAKAIQQKLSAPSIEKEKSILRFMTTRA
jgi:ribosomal protein S6